jgi:histone H3/H4
MSTRQTTHTSSSCRLSLSLPSSLKSSVRYGSFVCFIRLPLLSTGAGTLLSTLTFSSDLHGRHTFFIMSEQLDLPLAPIHRIVKAAVPAGAGVSKDVKQALGKAASLFILYLTSTSANCSGALQRDQLAALVPPLTSGGSLVACCYGFTLPSSFSATDVCKSHHRLTVNGEDVLAALEEIEFDMFLEPLQAYLASFREDALQKKKTKAAANASADGAAAAAGGGAAAPATKKRRAPSTKKAPAAAGGDVAGSAAGAAADDAPSPKRAKAATGGAVTPTSAPASAPAAASAVTAAASGAGADEEHDAQSHPASESEAGGGGGMHDEGEDDSSSG